MASYVRQRPAGWFWLVGTLITLWGSLGCAAWVAARSGLAFAPPEAPPGLAFALAAGSVLGGGIALLNKRRVARWLFLLAALAAVGEMVWLWMVRDLPAGDSTPAVALAGIVLVVAAALVWFANYSRRHGWIC